MKLLQTPRLRKAKTYVLFRFTWIDILVLMLMVMLGFIIGYLGLPFLTQWVKALIVLGVVAITSPLLFYLEAHNARAYIVLFRMIIFTLTPKKYGKKRALIKRLIPYQALVNNAFILLKPRSGKRQHLGFIKFKGLDISKYDEEDRQRIINNLIDILNNQKSHFSFIKTKTSANYDLNIENIDIAKIDSKFNEYKTNIKQDFIDEESRGFIENYYVVLYDANVNELTSNIELLSNMFNDASLSNEFVTGVDLIYLLNKINNVSPDYAKIDEFFLNNEFQQNSTLIQQKELKKPKINKFKTFIKNITSLYAKQDTTKNILNKYDSYLDNIDDLINIKTIDFKSDHYVLNNSSYIQTQTISKIPLQLTEMWARYLFDNDNMVIWHFDPISPNQVSNLLDKSQRNMTDKINTTKSRFSNKRSSLDIEATEHLSYKILIDDENLINSQMMIITRADDKKELRQKIKDQRNKILRSKITLNNLLYRQFEGLAQSQLIPSWWLHEHTEMISSNIAAGWPFINDEFNDGDILLTGNSLTTGNAFVLDQFVRNEKRRNFNMMIFGNSGSGKTVFTKKLITKNLAKGNDCIIIDPENEYTELIKKLNLGTIIDFGMGNNTSINPLQITNVFIDDDNSITQDNNTIIINKHISFLEHFFELALEEMKSLEKILLINAITKLYEKFKFYESKNNITQLEPNKYPLMQDLIDVLRSQKYQKEFDSDHKVHTANTLADKLSFLFTGRGRYATYYNAYTSIVINSNLTIFNTQRLVEAGKDESSVGLALYMMLQFIQNQIYYNKIHKETNTLLCIDEAHVYLNRSTSSVFDFIFTMTKRIRKYRGSLMLTTQNPQDFQITSSSGLNAESIAANCQYSVFFSLKQNDVQIVDQMYRAIGGLNNTEKRFLVNAKAGQCLFTINANDRSIIQAHYNNYEKYLFWK